eukprot:g30134.t1
MVPVEGGQGRGGEYASGGGILLEVAEMASDDFLDADAGGIVVLRKGHQTRNVNSDFFSTDAARHAELLQQPLFLYIITAHWPLG